MDESEFDIDLAIYKAALHDDWESVKHIFERHPEKLDAGITKFSETPLHIAVGTNLSYHFVEKLVDRIVSVDVRKLRTGTNWGTAPLHYASQVGNTRAVKLLLSKDPSLADIGVHGWPAVSLAAKYGHKDTLCYLLEATSDETIQYPEVQDADVLNLSITAGFYDVALYLVEKYPDMVRDEGANGKTALQILAAKPHAFPSGSGLGALHKLIYSMIAVNLEKTFCSPIRRGDNIMRSMTNSRPHLLTGCLRWAYYCLSSRLWVVLRHLVPCVKEIQDMKVMHIQAQQLVQEICSSAMKTANHSIAWNILGRAMCTAAEHGIHELIEECLKTYPGAVWHAVEGLYLFVIAIKYRQEKVYNLIYQMSGHKEFVATDKLSGEETTLHIAARLAPVHRLKSITGAALQMQRELQWFKEVEKFVQPSYKEALNSEQMTPRMLFTDEHSELLKEGQTWMIDTASSSLVVAALIVTVAFAAAFTVPGGSNNDGLPLFSGDGVFILFMVSDAIALFSSSTSVLMLLAILTSRYAEEDFLYALPNRMTIGLMSLFLSLATTMAAFSATLVLVLRHQISWIVAPVVLLASIPITLFAFLQFPLLKELVIATYGPSIFCKQNNVLLH